MRGTKLLALGASVLAIIAICAGAATAGMTATPIRHFVNTA